MSRPGKALVRCACFGLAALAVAATCDAQVYIGRRTPGRKTPHKGSVEVSGGVVYQGGKDLRDFTATLTRNPTTGTGPFALFRSDATLPATLGVQARLGFYLSSALSIEGGVQAVRPNLEVRLSADAESAPDTVATESITSYLFTGSVLYHMGRGARLKPFVMAGAGQVRDLHAGNELVETGLEYHAGGGIKSWFGTGRRKLGLRAEVLVSIRDGGVGAEDERRVVPTAGLSLAYLF